MRLLLIWSLLAWEQFLPFPGAVQSHAVRSDQPWITSSPYTTLRNNFAGCVGLQFTVGTNNLTIVSLGRWVNSGNTQTHTLYLKDSSGNGLASVAVNTSGATAGQYLDGSITPTTVTASASYFVCTSETSGGDQWQDATSGESFPTTNAAASLTAAYCSDPCTPNGAMNLGSVGQQYGGVNFQYH